MTGIPCGKCAKVRKVEQVWTEEGWHNPECWSCGDPGFVQPFDPDAHDARTSDDLPRTPDSSSSSSS